MELNWGISGDPLKSFKYNGARRTNYAVVPHPSGFFSAKANDYSLSSACRSIAEAKATCERHANGPQGSQEATWSGSSAAWKVI